MTKRKYPWEESGALTLEETERLLSERRQELLTTLPSSDNSSQHDAHDGDIEPDVVEEWLALTRHRDFISRQKVAQENRANFDSHMIKLLELLSVIGSLDHSHINDTLRQSLVSVYWELSRYVNKLEIKPTELCLVKTSEDAPVKAQASSLPNIPEEKFVTNVAIPRNDQVENSFCTLVKKPLESTVQTATVIPVQKLLDTPNFRLPSEAEPNAPEEEKIVCASSPIIYVECSDSEDVPLLSSIEEAESDTKTVPLQKTPKNTQYPFASSPKKSVRKRSGIPISVDLRKDLLKGREKLRGTPGVERSPGLTPVRVKPAPDLTNHGDMVTYALQRKFKNVRRMYKSPAVVGSPESQDESFNISID